MLFNAIAAANAAASTARRVNKQEEDQKRRKRPGSKRQTSATATKQMSWRARSVRGDSKGLMKDSSFSSHGSKTIALDQSGQTITSRIPREITAPRGITSSRSTRSATTSSESDGSLSGFYIEADALQNCIVPARSASLPGFAPCNRRSDRTKRLSRSTSELETARQCFSTSASALSLENSRHESEVSAVFADDGDTMTDIILVGKDGVKVPATKCVLACKSPVFQELFTDQRASQEVELFIGNFDESVIRAMWEHCNINCIRQSALSKEKDPKTAQLLVELVGLARVYALEMLCKEASSILFRLLTSLPWIATSAYEATDDKDVLLKESLLEFIKLRCPELLLDTIAIQHFSSKESLDGFLEHMGSSESETLLYTDKWLKAMGEKPRSMTSEGDSSSSSSDSSYDSDHEEDAPEGHDMSTFQTPLPSNNYIESSRLQNEGQTGQRPVFSESSSARQQWDCTTSSSYKTATKSKSDRFVGSCHQLTFTGEVAEVTFSNRSWRECDCTNMIWSDAVLAVVPQSIWYPLLEGTTSPSTLGEMSPSQLINDCF